MTSRGPFPHFFRNPIKYSRWAAHEKPAIFYSILIGSCGPLQLLIVPPIRRWMGVEEIEAIPLTYPSMFCLVCCGRRGDVGEARACWVARESCCEYDGD